MFTGDVNTQERQRHVFDLGVVGLLGVGQIDVIPDDKGQLRVDYTDSTTSLPATRQTVQWGGDTGLLLGSGDGLGWNGTDIRDMSNWNVSSTPSPEIGPRSSRLRSHPRRMLLEPRSRVLA